MKPISNRERVLVIALLSLTVFCTLTKAKIWDYEKIKSIEYNPEYNEKFPVIDTITPFYKNANRILVRTGFKIQGHDKIGVCTGGSQLWFECSDTCKKCLSLKGG